MTKIPITEGATCVACRSICFGLKETIEHIANEPAHQYWKFGEGKGVVYINLLLNYWDAQDKWFKE